MTSTPRRPNPVQRVRRALREIERSSATRDRSTITRIRNVLLLLSLLSAPAVPMLATYAVTRRSDVGAIRMGLEQRGTDIVAVSADDDAGSFAWTPTAVLLGEVRVVAEGADRGWPITVARSLEVRAETELYLTPQSPRRTDPVFIDAVRGAIDAGVRQRSAAVPGVGADVLVRGLERERAGLRPPIERLPVGVVLAGMSWWVGTSMLVLALTPVARWALHVRGEVGRVREKSTRARGRCPSCGYDLRGSEWSARCPECGRLDF